jgi:putative membrane protein
MGRLIRLIILLVLLVLALAFALRNADPVMIDYYFGTQSVPLSLALVIVLAVGAVIGMFASAGMVLRAKRENSKLRRTIKKSEKGVMHLQSLPAKPER